jgi:glutaredoxin 3
MNIIAYTKTGCPWCNGVIEYLDNAGVEYEEREVTGNPKYMEEMKKKSGQDKTPTLDIDGHILADSDKEQVDKYLKSIGAI